LGSKLVQELGSFTKGSKNPTTQINTPKYVEEVTMEVMQANKAIELLLAMAIVSLNMGNLNLEVNNLKNRLAKKKKGKGGITSGIEQRKGLLEGIQAQHKYLEEEQNKE